MSFVVTSTLANGKGRVNHMIRNVQDKAEALAKFKKDHPARAENVVTVHPYT